MEEGSIRFNEGFCKKNSRILKAGILLAAFILVLYYTSIRNFLLFHWTIELFCIITAFCLLITAMNTKNIAHNSNFMFLGISFGFVGIFIVLHTMTYADMNIFPGDTSDITIQLRTISAFFESISFLLFAAFYDKDFNNKVLFYVYSGISLILIYLVFTSGIFPSCFIEGSGSTLFKKILEFIIILGFGVSIVLLTNKRKKLSHSTFKYLILSLTSITVAEVFFSLYVYTASPLNISGHILKFISFYFVYKSVIEANLNAPYRLLDVQKAYFQQLFEGSPEAIVILDAEDRVVDINRGFENLFQYSVGDIKGCSLNEIIVPEDMYKKATEYNTSVLEGSIVKEDAVRKRKDGSLVNVHILGYPITFSSEQIGIYGIYSDITEQKQAEGKIMYLSFHDKLTGLYNRAFFEEELKRLDTERQLPISLIMGDLNNLKLSNDIFGHDEGDKLLVKMSEILKSCCRGEDIISRWGGDEFLVLLPRTNEKTASKICRRIRKACSECHENPIQPSIALGVSTKTRVDEDIIKVLNDAEHRMYRNKLMENKNARHSTIASLKKLLLEKDYETREHTLRVQELSKKMGQALNLSSSQLEELSLLALLHDIGKIAIPHGILANPGQLSKEDWNVIKKHSEIGYRIAQSSNDLASIAYAILSHHERWDGNGYPQGLQEEKIPFISRIISIIDTFDVMTHDRIYGKKLSLEDAIGEIKRCSGSQFDPMLVDVFVKIISDCRSENRMHA